MANMNVQTPGGFKSVTINMTLKGEVTVVFKGAIWAKIDIEKCHRAMLREMPKYYKQLKDKEIKEDGAVKQQR